MDMRGNAVSDKRVDFTYNDAGQLDTIARFADLDGVNLVASTLYTYNEDLRLAQQSGPHDQQHGPGGHQLRLHLRRQRQDRHAHVVRRRRHV